ncbi:carboxypeptidase-like regulatory domain-containing protein [Labilibaculum sp.]|uniref:carboxypeptidase-like regulatory domain-containing protein n=1 Tax=Labilibaculum sp. TaxID=2060723 RepID=UPI002AA65DCB|nr:carboxypeptidase-like regulatory domain-containing protein [Labilibaculum sp.]
MKSRKTYQNLVQSIILNALLVLIVCSSHTSNAQNSLLQNKISIDITELSINDALDSIAAKNNCYFTYNSDLFANQKKLNLKADEVEFEILLRKIVQDTSLTFQVVNRHIIIVPTKYKTDKPLTSSIIPYISYRNISGKVTNQSAKIPLPYASIGIRGKHIGTISNQDGEFALTLSSENSKDTLIVSYVGFKNFEIPVSDISNKQLQIKLKEDFISLQEVVIRNNDPKSILKAAVNKIEINYPKNASNLTSFYRESVHKNSKYMIYLESVLEIYKNPYSENNLTDKVKVFKSRKIYDVSRLDTISFRLKGGIQGCLMLDIVKNRPEFLDPEFIDLYSYRLSDISTFNNKSVYVIDFEPKPFMSTPLLEGKLIIETGSLAIIGAEFGYNQDRLPELTNRFISKGNPKIKVRPTQVLYSVNYRNIDGKYFLNHTLGNLKFKVKNKRKLFSQTFSTTFEMATTKLDTINVRKFKHRETIAPTTILSTEKLSYDPKFWGNQTFIKPEDNIKEAIKRISSSMQQVAMDTSNAE